MPDFKPTDEQESALGLFKSGKSMGIEAGAGTGKTSTLTLLAGSKPNHVRGQYVAFNKAIVVDAGTKMPDSVACNTAHSLAFRSVGKNYSHRLNSNRMRSADIARRLRIDPFMLRVGDMPKVLQPSYLAGLVMRSITPFCQTADEEPSWMHVPYVEGIDELDGGKRTFANNNELARHVLPYMVRAWDDLMSYTGELPYRHDHYLKAWQLSSPRISADYILFDEAQDANPVMLDVIRRQKHAQLVFVGDSNQAIYEFTGAVNALRDLPVTDSAFLTQSFRFGPGIAAIANELLAMLASPILLSGCDMVSIVGPVADPDCVLTRTNATAVSTMLKLQGAGARPHLVGGGTEVLAFARAAADLKAERGTTHPDLACFDTWGEVQTYVDQDEQGSELKLLVSLVDEFGEQAIVAALDRMPSEAAADVVISTAHKSKGREWKAVQLAADFPDEITNDSELRLMYVAATRARRELDISSTWLGSEDEDEEEEEGVIV